MASGGRKWFGQACPTTTGPSGKYLTELRKRNLRESAECCIRCNSAHFSQDCDGHRYETISGFMSDLFKDGGDGVLQFQDGTPALNSGQWTELDGALAKAPHPAAPAAGPPSRQARQPRHRRRRAPRSAGTAPPRRPACWPGWPLAPQPSGHEMSAGLRGQFGGDAGSCLRGSASPRRYRRSRWRRSLRPGQPGCPAPLACGRAAAWR